MRGERYHCDCYDDEEKLESAGDQLCFDSFEAELKAEDERVREEIFTETIAQALAEGKRVVGTLIERAPCSGTEDSFHAWQSYEQPTRSDVQKTSTSYWETISRDHNVGVAIIFAHYEEGYISPAEDNIPADSTHYATCLFMSPEELRNLSGVSSEWLKGWYSRYSFQDGVLYDGRRWYFLTDELEGWNKRFYVRPPQLAIDEDNDEDTGQRHWRSHQWPFRDNPPEDLSYCL